VLRSRAVHTAARRLPAVVLALAATVASATVIPAASGAESTTRELLEADARYAAEERSAELELFAIEARLSSSRAEAARLQARTEAVAARLAAARRIAAAARAHLAAANRLLAERLLALYQQGETDPLAIVFGAESLGDAIDGLEGLSTLAAQDARLAAQARTWRQRARAQAATLARKAAALRRAEDAQEARATALAEDVATRETFLAGLRAQRRLTAAQIAAATASARAAQEKAHLLAPPAAAADAATATPVTQPDARPDPVPAVTGPRTLTVVATAYSLPGRTATGVRVGWGVVAVDPGVIPLGTRLTIPGYGKGVAADVGSAIRGSKIDLWFPTRAKALDWGTRTVTITVH
jgi:3D (Asp-Asp-Asp) domain-containing protein